LDDPSGQTFLSHFKHILSQNFNLSDESGEHRGEIELLNNLENFFTATVREVMVPRTKMVTIDISKKIQDAAKIFHQTGFTRIPVQDKQRDHIVGVLHAIDLFKYFGNEPHTSLAYLIRKPNFVTYSQLIHNLLMDFRKMNSHLAIVIDEHGGVDGLITIGDIIQELVGEIPNENVKNSEPDYEHIEDGLIIMDANMDLDIFNELYHTDFDKVGIETIGGYICHHLGEIPQKGDSFKIDSIPITIEESTERNLIKLRLTAPEK